MSASMAILAIMTSIGGGANGIVAAIFLVRWFLPLVGYLEMSADVYCIVRLQYLFCRWLAWNGMAISS
jgi:hypothetical protein